MNFDEWVKIVPEEIRGDSLWKMKAYQIALFLADIGWKDVTKLMSDRRTIALSDQLYRAIGSIGANLSEGYSRNSGKDRARFYEYALGSARESRTWYFDGRHVLEETITTHRISLITEVIRLLLTMIPNQADRTLREEQAEYIPYSTDTQLDNIWNFDTKSLLINVPIPDE